MEKQFLEAGKIVGTHGIRGDIKVQSWCDSPDVLCQFDTLYWADGKAVTIERASVHKNVVLMHLKGVDTIEAAERLKHKILHLDREDVALPGDLVFIQDILSLPVHDLRIGADIGILKDVITTNPAYDLYEIKTADSSLVYLPATKPFLKEVDLEKGIIFVETIEGLL